MAKITANGAHEVARWDAFVGGPDSQMVPVGQILLRSDGVVLRKSTVKGDGWTRAFKLRSGWNGSPDTVTFEGLMERRGYRLDRRA